VPSVADRLVRAAAASRRYLDRAARREIAGFVLSRQNPDGGFRGRGAGSDLYYTVFAAAALKALGWRVPLAGLWRYARQFGAGESLDLAHLVCLVRLRALFPMRRKTRQDLGRNLERHGTEGSYGQFLRLLAGEGDGGALRATMAGDADPTTRLAAALVAGCGDSGTARQALLSRCCADGGFAPSAGTEVPDLLSTAAALFALAETGTVPAAMRRPCLAHIESLWRDCGGFAGHACDAFADVEYTFYALLGIGCLMDR